MRWLADECVAATLVTYLREAGHDVAYVAEMAPGITDPEVLALAQAEGRLLLTEDKDFGDAVYRQGHEVPGVVLLRIEGEQQSLQLSRLETAATKLGNSLYGHYTVVEEVRFRSRPLP